MADIPENKIKGLIEAVDELRTFDRMYKEGNASALVLVSARLSVIQMAESIVDWVAENA